MPASACRCPLWNEPAWRAVIEVLPAHVAGVVWRGCRSKDKTPLARSQRQRLLDRVQPGNTFAPGLRL
jgi:hypothetical protein